MARVSLKRLRDIKADSAQAVKDAFERVQNATAEALQSLYVLAPLLDGRLVTYLNGAGDGSSGSEFESNERSGRIVLGPQGPVAVQHGLGRAYRGFIVVRTSGVGRVFESYPPQSSHLRQADFDPTLAVVLGADSAVTVTLWVF